MDKHNIIMKFFKSLSIFPINLINNAITNAIMNEYFFIRT